jgi:hypothetical protein
MLYFHYSGNAQYYPPYIKLTGDDVIFTPKGSSVPDAHRYNPLLPDTVLSSSQRATLINHLDVAYDGAELIEDPSFKYNCHGYALHMMSPDNSYSSGDMVWIGKDSVPEGEDPYWNDGSYIQVTQETHPAKVSWVSVDHSAITTDQSGWVISKWGSGPRVKHKWDKSINGGGTIKYYVNKLEISGPSEIPCSNNVTYSIPQVAVSYTVTWSVTGSGLSIVSGQGTRTVTVRNNGSNPGTPSGNITATVVERNHTHVSNKSVTIGMNIVSSISGPSTAGVSSQDSYYASPVISSSTGSYQWVVTPSATVVNNGSSANISFPSAGTYTVKCRIISNLCGTGTYNQKTVVVESGISYVATPGGSRGFIKIALEKASSINSSFIKKVNYTLYNQNTGVAVVSGQMAVEGDMLDFSNLPNGVYILKIETDKNTFSTHRILLN